MTVSLASPKITVQTSVEEILAIPVVAGFVADIGDETYLENFLVALTKTVEQFTSVEGEKRSTAMSLKDYETNSAMYKKNIVPSRFKEHAIVTFDYEVETITSKFILRDVFREVSANSIPAVYNMIYRGLYHSEDPTVLFETQYEKVKSSVHLVSTKNEKIKCLCLMGRTREGKPVIKFKYPKQISDYRVSLRMSSRARGDSTSSITQIVKKIIDLDYALNVIANEKRTSKENKTIICAKIKDVLGSDDVDFGYSNPEVYSTFSFNLVSNPLVRYRYIDGSIKLHSIDCTILEKLDPVLAMTLFR